ncbi:MAG: hypothetical protein FWG27_05585 [Treponema sp.]|nr:hypothetical protein [Treponema sp.]
MRKPIVPRFLLLLILYAAIFILLVQFQFSKNTLLTMRTGNLVIQGNYGAPSKQTPNIYPLSGTTSVFFGGIEFILGDGLLITSLQNRSINNPCRPERMTVADDEVFFHLDQGTALIFTTQYTGGAIELVIRADFSGFNTNELDAGVSAGIEPKYNSLTIPFKPIRTSAVIERDQRNLISTEGINYTFSRNTGTDSVVLEDHNPAISYRILPDKETIGPGEFIIPAALDSGAYEAALGLWLDQSYLLWNRSAAGSGTAINGELICSYMNEALKRGTYRAAAAAVSASWNPDNVFYEASAYVGRIDAALRSLSAAERERSTRLSRLFNEKSTDFLKEFHVIEFLAVRGYDNLIDDAVGILRTFDPAGMTAEQAAGLLECRLDWVRYRPDRHNPFDRFVDQALFVITGSLQKSRRNDSALVFTKTGSAEEADAELNLRLGSALMQYEDETRIALGRTLILSVLSLANNAGDVPRKIQRNFAGGSERLKSQRIYRICFMGENYARAQAAGPGLWAWTAASSIIGSASANGLDILVNFSAGETHYMILRGIKPITSLQISGYTYNQDNQFERYDSSGWAYSTAEQTLLVKIRHRLPVERITITY